MSRPPCRYPHCAGASSRKLRRLPRMRTQTNGQQGRTTAFSDEERAQRSALAVVRRVERAFDDYPWRDRRVYLRARKHARARAMEVVGGTGDIAGSDSSAANRWATAWHPSAPRCPPTPARTARSPPPATISSHTKAAEARPAGTPPRVPAGRVSAAQPPSYVPPGGRHGPQHDAARIVAEPTRSPMNVR